MSECDNCLEKKECRLFCGYNICKECYLEEIDPEYHEQSEKDWKEFASSGKDGGSEQ